MSDTTSKPAPKNPLAASLLQMAGQSNVIAVRRPFVAFTGTLEAAMLLDQLLYWTSRSVMGGWIAKSDAEFQEELCLTRYSVRAARDRLVKMGIIETDVRRFNNFPTQHYHVRMDKLLEQWSAFVSRLSEIEQTDCAKSDSRLSENGQTLTETTYRDSVVVVNSGLAEISKAYEKEFGALTPMIAEAIQDDVDTYSAEWVAEAMEIAVLNNKRSWKYVQGVLKQCKAKNVRPSLNKRESENHQPAVAKKAAKPKSNGPAPDAQAIIRKVAQNAARA